MAYRYWRTTPDPNRVHGDSLDGIVIHVSQARIDIFGIFCVLLGFGMGYAWRYFSQLERIRESQRRYDAAYRRYWQGLNDEEPF